MPNTDIQVHRVSKKYHLRPVRRRYATLRDVIAKSLRLSPRRFPSPFERASANGEEEIWALRDISLDIKQGELVGIVGRNGAGKSTLLKILARVTEPTEGYVRIRGRASSLLEVGTGFHQELTGRENIYLNGSILGMKRGEINQRFDEMVDFSGVHKFIDTPVKHYSSGMRVRLAFSVAAHLRADILFIDEVLAVGDYEFQRKCLAKIGEIVRDGRTVLFVSHQLAVIKELCQTCVFLEQGELKYRGPVDDALARYFLSFADVTSEENSSGWGNILINGKSDGTRTLKSERPFDVQAHFKLAEEFLNGELFFKIQDTAGNAIVREKIAAKELVSETLGPGDYHVTVELPPLWLVPAIYVAHFWFTGQTKAGQEKKYSSPQVLINVSGPSRKHDVMHIFLRPSLQWKFERNHRPSSMRQTGV